MSSTPDYNPMLIRSKVNQPDRVFANSSDDTSNTAGSGFSEFTARFQTPILGAKRLQLLRTTIPNAVLQIPDYQLCFWYYRLPAATTTPSVTYLQNVRLYPSNWQLTSSKGGTLNRFVTGGQDFVNLLNTAAGSYSTIGTGDDVNANPFYAAGDVTFTWDSVRNQITFTGNTGTNYYCAAGYNDPVVIAAQNAGSIVMYNVVGSTSLNNATIQPQVPGYTLNLRVGYGMSGQGLVNQGTQGNPLYANITNRTYVTASTVPVDSYPNLVYTGSVYLYADIIPGSSLGSGGQHNLLAVVPVSGPQFAVTNYVAATLTWLSKVSGDTIYDLRINMRDDANQPYVLPDNATVNVELGIHYD